MSSIEVAKLVKTITVNHWNYRLQGPAARHHRAAIASAILGRKIVKSAKESQWNNWFNLLRDALGVSPVGKCTSQVEDEMTDIINAA